MGRTVTELTDAQVEFGLIRHDDWFQPDWIDEDKARASRVDMVKNNVIYGGMCRLLPIIVLFRNISF
jgi:alpha 1,2-mannosyltransferase